MEKEKFYLTTAIAYTSQIPHIGNVYEAILADAICRYKRLQGYDVRFQTGTDEHGQKIQIKAKEKNISPQQYVDEIASSIKRIYDSVNVSYDHFIRTTDSNHVEIVQKIFRRLYEQGDIYKGEYEGSYCVACESFFTESQLVDGKCPDCGKDVVNAKEEAYFLKLTNYQARLIEHINTHPEFIQPESRKNEMINTFLNEPLPDLCVSRTSFDWGVPVTFDDKHVVYVWIDALSNYISGLEYNPTGEQEELFAKYWPAECHLIGKDILRFHTIYWPIMLMALDLPLPKQIFGHPWILFNKEKMSKSKGNVLYTDELVKYFGVDAVRYYCLHDIPFSSDGNLTYELMIERINSDLANTYGNLLNRTLTMVAKYFDSRVVNKYASEDIDNDLIQVCLETPKNVNKYMNQLRVADALEEVIKLARRGNKYIDETEPWVLGREGGNKDRLSTVLYNLIETLRFIAVLLQAFLPETAEKSFAQLNTSIKSFDSLNNFGAYNSKEIGTAEPLFNRIDSKKLLDSIEASHAKEKEMESYIGIEEFSKVNLVVGEVIDCKPHPNAEKLLVSQINIGKEVRQIVSGIAQFYSPTEMIGKKVIVVANLKPVELRGVLSEGMILAGGKKKLELLEVNKLNPGDLVK